MSTRRRLIGAHRDRAERYLIITIAAFAVTVAGTRWYLDTAGYPTVGGGELHVAHVLWGGLALFLAALLPLLYTGRRSLLVSALLAGVGVGLFIDEVGKFLTTTNDYFYAPAAPIIYGSILLLVLIWLLVRRRDPGELDATHALLDAIGDGVDGRLTQADREHALQTLERAGSAPDVAGIPAQLALVLRSAAVDEQLADPGWVARSDARRLLERILPTRLERWLVTIGLVLATLSAALASLLLLALSVMPQEEFVASIDAGRLEIPTDPLWIGLVLAVNAASGIIAAAALVLRVRGSRRWLDAALLAVLVDLVVGELLAFYAAQFTAFGAAVWSVILLGLVLDLRIRVVSAELAQA